MADHPLPDAHDAPEKESQELVAPPPTAQEAKKPGRFDKTFEHEEKAVHALVDMSQIQLKAEDLYDKDKVDLEQVELDDVWTLLQYASSAYIWLGLSVNSLTTTPI